ncbi:uncharacterized protein LOC112693301 [Sipha flava]|uniref:Uncharacterized protein LOC112693301 n=1 Tax=Sipha flava TaxID=143950 RepID=A0A8B8GM02_9HEMI|nr:uncharacterized protein LOC112693301 [Sipha flava]
MALLNLTETMVTQLFPKIGQRSVFLKNLGELKNLKNLAVKNIELQPKHPAIDWDSLEFEVTDIDNTLLPIDNNHVEEEILLNEIVLRSSNTSIAKKNNEYSSDVNLSFAICQLFKTNYFNEHYQAFNVTPIPKYICINLEQLHQRSHKVRVSGSDLIFIPL